MPGLEVENVYETDSSDNEENHSKLLSSVSQLDSTQRIKPAQRKEIASEVSEFNLNKGLPTGKSLINVKELVKVLEKKPEYGVICKKIKKVTEKTEVLPKPLEKPVEDRIKRSIGFEKVKNELRKWDAIVTRNALKDHITFPLNDNSMKMGKSTEFLSQFKTQTPLEIEMAKLLNVEEKKENSNAEEFPLTYEEMLEKRKEMAQLRAKLSYRQSKAQRQSKIKSKKYHRLLKREKIKNQLKEFEVLQKADPEAALKKLEELDKTRARERASLRHRNTGKWAKNLTVRAKYDVETRKVLAEQLKMSRELTQKVSQPDSSGDEETVEPVLSGKETRVQNTIAKSSTDNPWMLDVSTEVQDFVSDYKKFWSEKGKEISQNEVKDKEICNEKNYSSNGSYVQSEKTLAEKLPKLEVATPSECLGKTIISPVKISLSPKIAKINAKKTKIGRKISETSSEKNEADCKKAKINAKKTKIDQKISETSPEKNEADCKKVKINAKKTKIDQKISETSSEKNEADCKKAKINSKKTKIDQKISETSPEKNEADCKKAKVGSKRSKINTGKTDTNPVKKKKCESVITYSSSGVWLVTPTTDESFSEIKKKENTVDIDNLFDKLNDELLNKATKRIQKIKKTVKRNEKKKNRKTTKNVKTEFDLSLKNRKKIERPDMDMGLLEGGVEDDVLETVSMQPATDISKNKSTPSIDPKNFIQIKPKRLNTRLPENITEEEEALDDEKRQQLIIEEAFGDDDVMAEFDEMKKEEEESSKLEIDTTLPGWGEWGGTGIVQNPQKKRLLLLNVPPRKDKLKRDVIINENANPSMKKHLVKEVPHPFTSVEAFEANIRAPVGRDWVPETAHQKLIQKEVVTKMGAIIEPMSQEELIKFKKEMKSPYKGKSKKVQQFKK